MANKILKIAKVSIGTNPPQLLTTVLEKLEQPALLRISSQAQDNENEVAEHIVLDGMHILISSSEHWVEYGSDEVEGREVRVAEDLFYYLEDVLLVSTSIDAAGELLRYLRTLS